jgi:hypothetical protein
MPMVSASFKHGLTTETSGACSDSAVLSLVTWSIFTWTLEVAAIISGISV